MWRANHWKRPNSGKDWGQEKKGTTEDEMVAWLHRLIGQEFEQTPGDSEGQGILACCSPWGRRVGHDLATEQNKWPWAVWLLWALVSLSIRLCIITSTFQGLCPKQRKGNTRKRWTVSGTIKEKLFISTSAAHHLCIFCRLYLQAPEAGDEMGLLNSKSGKSGKDKEPSHWASCTSQSPWK